MASSKIQMPKSYVDVTGYAVENISGDTMATKVRKLIEAHSLQGRYFMGVIHCGWHMFVIGYTYYSSGDLYGWALIAYPGTDGVTSVAINNGQYVGTTL